jgi:hypothetical protein
MAAEYEALHSGSHNVQLWSAVNAAPNSVFAIMSR